MPQSRHLVCREERERLIPGKTIMRKRAQNEIGAFFDPDLG